MESTKFVSNPNTVFNWHRFATCHLPVAIAVFPNSFIIGKVIIHTYSSVWLESHCRVPFRACSILVGCQDSLHIFQKVCKNGMVLLVSFLDLFILSLCVLPMIPIWRAQNNCHPRFPASHRSLRCSSCSPWHNEHKTDSACSTNVCNYLRFFTSSVLNLCNSQFIQVCSTLQHMDQQLAMNKKQWKCMRELALFGTFSVKILC